MIYYIAEVGLAHDGSLGIAHSYIDALSKTGINAIKFQMHLAEYESSEFEKFRVNFSYEDKSRLDYWNRTSFNLDQWIGLKRHCEEYNLDFLVSPFSIEACKRLSEIGLKVFKVGSGELNNFLLLDTVNEIGEKVILSSGLSNYEDLDAAINRFDKIEKQNISLLQCTTAYPTLPNQWGLNNIKLFKEKYKNISIGYSDHSGQIFSSLAAISMGAELVEFHVTFDRQMFGPDSQSSLTIPEIRMLVEGGNKIYESVQSPINKDLNLDLELKDLFGKSLTLNKNLKKGSIIKIDDIETKKPGGMGIDAKDYIKIIGKKVIRDIKLGSFIKTTDFT